MPFVKLDCGILSSTIWFDRDAREVFLTALLMAEPRELREPMPQVHTDSLELTGWSVPAGWYGWVNAAGVGIVSRSQVPQSEGMQALKRLGQPDQESRSTTHDGRRLVRVDGGFIVLNFMEYRERDYTSADRSRRYRERVASRRDTVTTHRDITQAEAEAEAEAEGRKVKSKSVSRAPRSTNGQDGFDEFWSLYPKRKKRHEAYKAWLKWKPDLAKVKAALSWQVNQFDWTKEQGKYIPHPASWLNAHQWEDEPFHTQPSDPDEQLNRLLRGEGVIR